MKTQTITRKRMLVTLVVAALAIPAAGTALAGAYGGHGMGKGAGCEMGRGASMGERRGDDRMDGRLAFLKAEIGITEDQQSDWEKFETALRDNMSEAGKRGMQRGDDAGMSSAPERVARHIEHMQQRLQRMTKMRAALEELYTVLTPEQRQEADQLLPPGHGRNPGHGGGMRHRM